VRAVVVVAALVVGFGVVTLIALEGGEVVVLETGSGDDARETRTWIAEADGAWWIEAATEDRPFFRQVRRTGSLRVRRGDANYACSAAVQPEPGGHERIRGLLRAKYRWRDWWIGLVADTHASRAIRLECRAV